MSSRKQVPAPRSPDKLQQVFRHYQQGNLPAAVQLAEQLLRSNPDNATLIELSAVIALQTGKPELAVKHFKKQLGLQPDNALAHSNLCMALHGLGLDEEAFMHGQQAIRLDPQLGDAWNNLGNIYKAGNHLEGALEHYEKALQLDSSDPEIHLNAGATSQLLGDLETAEQHYRDALRISPDFAAAHNNLGAVFQKQERYDEAEKEYRAAISLQPGNPEFLTNLGTLMIDRCDQDAAIACFEKAIQAEPEYAGAWVSMGNLYDRLNDTATSQKYWDKALLLEPENTTVLCNTGYRLFERGEQKKAVDYFVRALKSNPNSAKGLAGLGKAMLRQDDLAKAKEYIGKAMSLAPWDIHAHIAQAHLHASRNQHDKAESEWRYVVEHRPDMPDGYIGLASHYSARENYDKAVEQYRLAETNGAISLRLYQNWSQMEEHVHHLEEAERLARKAVEIEPSYPGLKILQASLARRRKDYSAALALLEQVDKDAIDVKQTLAGYLFELGNVHDKLGNYAEAFAAYKEANEAKNCYSGRLYDPEEDDQKFRRMKDFFSRETWQQLSSLSESLPDCTPQPVFIVGFPRSGTSLLEQILGSHRKINPAGELSYISDIANIEGIRITGSQLTYPAYLLDPDAPLDSEKLLLMQNHYLSALRDSGVVDDNIRWVTDKMPHNAGQIGMIRLLFPRSPVIHISRHPLNPCLSAYFSNFKSTHRYTSSLASTARHYNNIMGMVDHYRDIGIDFLEIHYEDLVKDQEAVTRQVLDYIGAPWDPACLQHHKSDRVVRTASYEQVTQKVYTSSLNRYQNYWDAVQEIIPILQPTIERFGYTVEPPP